MTSEPMIVVVEGGVVSDVLGVVDYSVWDWDDFADSPVAYVDEHGGFDGELLQIISDTDAEMYDTIVTEFNKALLDSRSPSASQSA